MLTGREREVARLIAQGLTNKEIAAQLMIAQRTAESHVENILTKLGLASRAQVAVWVVQQSWSGRDRAGSAATSTGMSAPATAGAGLPAGSAPGTPGFAEVDLSAIDAMRRSLDLHLSGPAAASRELDELELAVERHGVRYGSIPDLLTEFAADMHRLRNLLTLRLTEEQRRRTYRMLARLGTLLGSNFCFGGRRDEGWQWLTTAERFAELAGDADAEGWTLAIRAKIGVLYGQFTQARALTRRALELPGCGPAARLWSWDNQAQILAANGRAVEAFAVLDKVIRGHERWQSRLPDGAFGYPERQLLRVVGAVHALAGDTGQAAGAIGAARTAFPDGYVQTLLSLDHATALIRQGELEHACAVAEHAWHDIPPAQRSGMLRNRFVWTLSRIPPREQTLTCVNDLRVLTTHA